MDEAKRKPLAARGWKIGTVAEFLQLTPEEAALLERKLARQQRRQSTSKRRPAPRKPSAK